MKRSTAIPAVLLAVAAASVWVGSWEPPPAALLRSSATEPTTHQAIAIAIEPPLTPVPAAASRPLSAMSIDGKDVAFPAARLVLSRRRGGGLSAVLCSDDPPAAIEQTYAGNSFLFPMALDVSSPRELPLATWEFTAGSGDDAAGVFLHGSRDQLRPSAVRVSFRKDGDDLVAYLDGTFLRFDPRDPIAPPDRVPVMAALKVNVETR